MPVNKSARFRFEIIDECLRITNKKWTKAELLRYVNRRLERHYGDGTSVSSSQLRYDLENMQSEYGAPIEMYRDGRSYLYKYEDPEFSIKNLPIQEEDIIKLNTGVSLLKQIKGFTIADEMADIIARLESKYQFTSTLDATAISFENSPSAYGVDQLEDVYHAIIRKNVLKMTYKAFHSELSREWTIHPYLLKQYDNRWYLLGYCQEKKSVSTYAFDRIVDIKISGSEYIENSFVDFSTYFDDIIGVTKLPGKAVDKIGVLFSAKMAPYVTSKPLHASQKVVNQHKDGTILVELSLIVNPELIGLLLGYGKDVTVLYPDILSLEVRAAALMVLENYE